MLCIKGVLTKKKYEVWKHINNEVELGIRIIVSTNCNHLGFGYSSDEGIFSSSGDVVSILLLTLHNILREN